MTKYYIENNTLYEAHIGYDEWAEDPRCYGDYCTHMCIWWNRYSLGDYEEVKGLSPIEYLEDLVADRLPEADTTDKNPIELLQLLYADKDFVALPLYIYEHSGITISTSDIVNPYGHWDSGMCGFIWTDRESFEEWYGSCDSWRDKAVEVMQSEVDEYDMYLVGEVYRVTITPFDLDLNCFDDFEDEYGSCYSRSYGDALAEELINTSAHLYDDYDEALAEYKKQLISSGNVWDALRIA